MRRVLYVGVALFAGVGGWLGRQNGAAMEYRGTATFLLIPERSSTEAIRTNILA
jgi:hypothetical protein